MSLEDMPQVQTQQIQPAEVPADLGNKLWAGVGQGIDNFINGLIERVGELGGAAITAAAGKALDTAANVGGAALSAGTAPFKEGFIPPSIGGKEAESPQVPAKERTPAMEVSPSNEASLGTLSPPSVGVSQTQGIYQGR